MRDGAQPQTFLPYGRQTIEDDDIAAVAAALKAELLTTGPLVEQFEAALAERVEARFAVVCNSGTAALHLAVKAAGLKPGEVCIVPAITFTATANCVRYEGGEVVFADVDPATGLMTPATLGDALGRAKGRRVRAVLPVHLGGHACDLPAIRRAAEDANAVVIEDACHALGTQTPHGPIGACTTTALACFSFHPVKTICTGEGGAVTTNDSALAERLKLYRSHGITRDPAMFTDAEAAFDEGGANPWYYEELDLGWNYRLPDVLCALGLSQLKKFHRLAGGRRRVEAVYRERLKALEPMVRTIAPPQGCDPVLHLFQVLIDFESAGVSRRQVMERLRARGIGSQVHYIPVHRQPYYRGRYGETSLPGAERFYRETLSLPLFPGMKDEDVARVVSVLSSALGRGRALSAARPAA
jgi:UDP-4-amino-4,6-dideoxy-N-acetyl-beta-L-altrosamine transaminase